MSEARCAGELTYFWLAVLQPPLWLALALMVRSAALRRGRAEGRLSELSRRVWPP